MFVCEVCRVDNICADCKMRSDPSSRKLFEVALLVSSYKVIVTFIEFKIQMVNGCTIIPIAS